MTPSRRNYNQEWLPSIFNDFFNNDWMVKANATAPAINVIESDTDYKVEVAAPGMTKEDFNIHLSEDNELVISMEKKTETNEEQAEQEVLAPRVLLYEVPTGIGSSGRCRKRQNQRQRHQRCIDHRIAETHA